MPPKQRKTRHSGRELTPPLVETTEQIIERRVAEAIAQYEARRNQETVINKSGPIPNAGTAQVNTSRECSYKTFQSCKPTIFTGTEGAIGLVHWIEKMESVIDISDCSNDKIVKYATCSLANKALTWWNAQVQIMGRTTAYSISWEVLKQMLMEEFCSESEQQKLETELWNIKMTGADIAGYTNRFQELARLVPHMVTPESERIKKYVKGLASQIRGMVMSSKPTTFRSAVDLAHNLTEDAILIGTLKTSETTGLAGDKRKWVESNDNQPQSNKKPTSNAKAYAAPSTEPKPYLGKKPKCDSCNRHHDGECFYCLNCKGWGHIAKNCKNDPPTPKLPITGCFICGEPGHYRNQCPQLNNNRNNQNNNNRTTNKDTAPARGYNLRTAAAQPDPYANIGKPYSILAFLP